LVAVLLTLAVPEVADPEDAAALVADAAATSALEVRHAVGAFGRALVDVAGQNDASTRGRP